MADGIDCECCDDGECCRECWSCICELCLETACSRCPNCCVACSCSRSTSRCCCGFITTLFAVAVATLIAVLVVAYAAVPARVTVEHAYLSRFALTNGTALAYDVSLTIAVRNRNFATGAWRAAPLDAELWFRGQTFARASARLESAEWGMSKARGKGLYRMTASSEENSGTPPVVLGGDGVVAEFVRERVAGVFELELVVVDGEVKTNEEHHHGKDSSVRVMCPLKLSLPTATAPFVAFTSVKCT